MLADVYVFIASYLFPDVYIQQVLDHPLEKLSITIFIENRCGNNVEWNYDVLFCDEAFYGILLIAMILFLCTGFLSWSCCRGYISFSSR